MNENFNTSNTPVPFQIEGLNIGGAMNLATGVFTAPRPGRYLFSLSGLVETAFTHVDVYVNGAKIGTAFGSTNWAATYSLHSVLDLKIGDVVVLMLRNGGHIHGDNSHFIGILLEEDFIL